METFEKFCALVTMAAILGILLGVCLFTACATFKGLYRLSNAKKWMLK